MSLFWRTRFLMLALLACLPMLTPPSLCACQLLSICGLETEHSSELPSDDTAVSPADSECHCTAQIPTTIPHHETTATFDLLDDYVPELRLLVPQNLGSYFRHITPPITTNSLFLQHCALIV